jgi:hypothetical protein
MRTKIMSKKALTVGIVLMLGVLVAGALAVWVFPGVAEARYGGGRGSANDGMGLCGLANGIAAGYRCGNGQAGSGMRGGQNAGLADCAVASDSPVGSLSEAEANALRAALLDEYNAKALYEQARTDLGSVRPLTQIERAEEKHIAALQTLFTRYGLEIPVDQAGEQDGTYATLADACAASVTAETANVALYSQLLPQVDNPDLVRVFTALQSASQNRHLPALQACAD